MAGDIEKEYGTMTHSASIKGIKPKYLPLLRWICRMVGAEWKSWTARKRKKEGEG